MVGPLLDAQQLVVSDQRTKQLQAALEYLLDESFVLDLDGVMDEVLNGDEALRREVRLRRYIQEESHHCVSHVQRVKAYQ